MKHYPQIVKVLDASRLIDCDGCEHTYRTESGRALGLGYQIVRWADDVDAPAYDERARWVGPFRTYGHARLAMERQLEAAMSTRAAA